MVSKQQRANRCCEQQEEEVWGQVREGASLGHGCGCAVAEPVAEGLLRCDASELMLHPVFLSRLTSPSNAHEVVQVDVITGRT